jgi:acetylornithine deacetylase/succinyl-diaminopimelate desuccinylase-like protein
MGELQQRIAAEVDRRADEICETLIEAARIRSEVPPGDGYSDIVRFFERQFAAIGLDTRIETVPSDVVESRVRRHQPAIAGPRPNLIAEHRMAGTPRGAFYCHLDTVPAGDLGRWSFDPFAPFVRDGYVWGRGTADSKGGPTAILWAIKLLRELGIPLQVSPVIALTTDEEIGPYSGLMYLTDSGAFDGCGWLYSADGIAGAVGYGCPGSIIWTIKVSGRSVHSASSFLGINPIERAAPLLAALVSAKESIERRRSDLPLSPEITVESGRKNITGLLNITGVQAGGVQTVIPSELTITGDRLYTSGEDVDQVLDELRGIVEAAKAADPMLDCSLDAHVFYEPFSQDATHPWLSQVQRVISSVRGGDLPLAALSGPSDVAYAANRLGVPVVIHGLTRYKESRTHSPDERCRVSDLLAITNVVARLAAGLAE